MDIKGTTIYEANAGAWLDPQYRRALNEGGTSSSKTFSIMQILILIARRANSPLIITVMSESMPHLKRGVIRDFFNILGESQDRNPCWNKTDKIYTWPESGTILEFVPADAPAKQRGARRKILFINEANNVSYPVYQEADIRTELFTFLDWNPVAEFWAHEHLVGLADNAYIHSTYLDARDVLPKEVVENIEAKRERDPNWWNVYGLGLLGKITGWVYPDFEQVEELPTSPDTFYGMDFGFTNDPSVLVKCVIIGDELFTEELFYTTGLTNDAISREMDLLGLQRNYDEIYADSAEPKSIQELVDKGWNVKPAEKGPGSVEYGHNKVRQFRHRWTQASLNCIKEQRNYRYIMDKDEKFTEKTTHLFSHGMDARRYAVSTHIPAYTGPVALATSYM